MKDHILFARTIFYTLIFALREQMIFVLPICIFGMTALINVLFFGEYFGLNIPLFNIAFISMMVLVYKPDVNDKVLNWLIGGSILSSISVLMINTNLSLFAYFVSVIAFSGQIQRPMMKSMAPGIFQVFINLMVSSGTFISKIYNSRNPLSGRLASIWRFGNVMLIPVLLLVVFAAVYGQASTEFGGMINDFISFFDMRRWFEYDAATIVFNCFFFWIMFVCFVKIPFKSLLVSDGNFSDNIMRKAKRLEGSTLDHKFNALKTEYKIALISLAMLNALSLLFNVFDLRYIWLDFSEKTAAQLSQFVHEGTGFLIFGICLATAVLAVFFRKNLNFYSKNKYLKILAFIWLGQNAFMAISVLFRNIKYIQFYGLADNRIGVLWFLFLVMIGLVLFYQKIKQGKSLFYVIRLGMLSAYLLLIIGSSVNWDLHISEYNVKHAKAEQLDLNYLVYGMAYNNLDFLDSNRETIIEKSPFSKEQTNEMIDGKIQSFDDYYSGKSWKSWNAIDHIIRGRIYE